MQTIKHQAWPDIGQFRNMIRAVKEKATFSHLDVNGDAVFDPSKPLPILQFHGTVKLHGTNAAIGVTKDGDIWYQSRSRVITLEDDNAGFVRFWKDLEDKGFTFKNLLSSVIHEGSEILVAGEWCGGNIQKGVALNQLEKMFVIFGVKVDGEWLSPEEVSQFPMATDHNIFNVYSIETYKIEIDFNKPEIAQDKLVKLVEMIEKTCPWGKKFGVEGIGEGAVFRPIDKEWESTKLWFKVKGSDHQISHVKTLAPVDIEKVISERAFVEMVVTEARCVQMIQKVKESGVKVVDRTHLAQALRWIYNDIVKEESDVAIGNGIDISKMGGMISNYTKQWFFKNEDKFDEL